MLYKWWGIQPLEKLDVFVCWISECCGVCYDILLNCRLCWTILCFLHQDQRERLSSQGSILSNGGEDLYASLNEKAIVVSPVATCMHVSNRQDTFNVECTSVFEG